MAAKPVFKVLLVGESGAGKTTYIKRRKTGEYTKTYSATTSPVETSLMFYTNIGEIELRVYDCGGQYQFQSTMYNHLYDVDCVMIMVDGTDLCSEKSLAQWYHTITTLVTIPVFIVYNKIDISSPMNVNMRVELLKQYAGKVQGQYFLSTKWCTNFEEPFLGILKTLTGEPYVIIGEAPAMTPPEVVLSPQTVARYAKMLHGKGVHAF